METSRQFAEKVAQVILQLPAGQVHNLVNEMVQEWPELFGAEPVVLEAEVEEEE